MNAKRILMILLIGLVGISAFVCYELSRAFRFPGDRGAVYDTWETANNNFKFRMTAYYEEGIFMPGAFYTCESATISSNEWREFKAFRGDDAIPLSHLNRGFRFVNDQTAYFYTADDFMVTTDAGRNWSAWKPILAKTGGGPIYWAIAEAKVEADGKGRAKLERYDEEAKDRVLLEVITEDYGRSWSVVQNPASGRIVSVRVKPSDELPRYFQSSANAGPVILDGLFLAGS